MAKCVERWQTWMHVVCGKMCELKNKWCNKGFVAFLKNKSLSWPRLEASDSRLSTRPVRAVRICAVKRNGVGKCGGYPSSGGISTLTRRLNPLRREIRTLWVGSHNTRRIRCHCSRIDSDGVGCSRTRRCRRQENIALCWSAQRIIVHSRCLC